MSSAFGSGLLSRLLLYRFSPTCSGLIGFRVGGLGHFMFGFVEVYMSLLVVSLSHLLVGKYEVMVRS